MDSDIKVQCDTHGETSAAFVCQHLLDGTELGFNVGVDPETPDEICPDAWCDGCEGRFAEVGEWTDELYAQADIKLVCTSCYSDIRERNWIQDDEAFDDLLQESIDHLNAKQDTLIPEFKLDKHARWDWHQETAQLVFSNDGKPAVICDIIFVGSISRTGDTWLWSWANESLDEIVKTRMREVRAYGEEQRFEKLAGAFWSGTPEDGWHMTAIAAQLLNAIGAYRTPDEKGFTYLVITRAAWAQ
ncbi:MAG TPA: hypothetical protein VIV63_05700 [Steroidobacteraceae bacterium]